MVSLRALALTAVAVAALSGAASAADLLPPPPEPAPYVVNDTSGWYLRGDVGVGVNNKPSASTAPNPAAGIPGASDAFYNATESESALVDFGVGYQVNKWFRADVTGELRGGSTFQGLEVCSSCTGAGNQLSDFYRGNLSSYIGMLNGYVDLGNWSGFTPYFGAGLGFAYNKISGMTDQGFNYTATAGFPTGGYFGDNGSTSFAWALMAGTSFDVTHNLKLEFGYRYLNYGSFKSGSSNCLSGQATPTFNCQNFNVKANQLASNDFHIGLRYYFDTPTPAPTYEQPLVRKY
jgi:opacity protein-like surface antigen